MKVIISLRPLKTTSKTRGVGVYTKELIAALKTTYRKHQFIPTSMDYYSRDADLIHFPFFNPFFLTLPSRQPLKTVVTIHDLVPLKFPSHFPRGIRGTIKWQIQKKSVRQSSHIITDSQSSKQDIIDILRIPSSSISIIPLAPSIKKSIPSRLMLSKTRKRYSLPDKFLLFVGDVNWNKNIVGLINEFATIEDPDLHLVLVGNMFTSKADIPELKSIERAIEASGKSSLIKRIGFLPSHHLPSLYSLATIYIQPSFYEGFGLPVLEAMQFGCPVISSDQGSLPEVGGDAVKYFNPHSEGHLATAIKQLLSSAPTRKSLSQKGIKQAAKFSWRKTARLTKEVYEKVLTQ